MRERTQEPEFWKLPAFIAIPRNRRLETRAFHFKPNTVLVKELGARVSFTSLTSSDGEGCPTAAVRVTLRITRLFSGRSHNQRR